MTASAHCYEGHTDWVNDVVVTDDSRLCTLATLSAPSHTRTRRYRTLTPTSDDDVRGAHALAVITASSDTTLKVSGVRETSGTACGRPK